MTNEELKKKILEIFEKAIGDWYEKDDGLFAEGYTPEEGDNRLKGFIADALIAAGIVDKSDYASMKETAVRYKAEVSKAEARVKEAELRAEVAESELERYTGLIKPLEDKNARLEHRAEVAERAVYNLAYGEWQREGARRAICEKYAPSTAQDYLDRAEKELAEEGKDD